MLKKLILTAILGTSLSVNAGGLEEVVINGNAVIFETGVDSSSVDKAISELTELENKGVNPIYFIVNSPGGSVLDGATLITHIKNSKAKVITVCRQLCASMGFHILQSGHRRLAYENAVIMSHPAYGGMQGTLQEMRTQLAVFQQLVEGMDRFAAKRVGVEYKEWEFRNLENIWYTGNEAKKANVVDGLAILRYANPQSEETTAQYVEAGGGTNETDYTGISEKVRSLR